MSTTVSGAIGSVGSWSYGTWLARTPEQRALQGLERSDIED